MRNKIIAAVLCLTLVLVLAACSKAPSSSQGSLTPNMPNPFTDYDSLDKINELSGGKLVHPPVMGVSEEHFSVMDDGTVKMAQYNFTLNSLEYTFRFAAVEEDISGVWIDGKTAFADSSEKELKTVSTGDMKVARWFTDAGQYVLSVKDDGTLEEETFAGIADELSNLTK